MFALGAGVAAFGGSAIAGLPSSPAAVEPAETAAPEAPTTEAPAPPETEAPPTSTSVASTTSVATPTSVATTTTAPTSSDATTTTIAPSSSVAPGTSTTPVETTTTTTIAVDPSVTTTTVATTAAEPSIPPALPVVEGTVDVPIAPLRPVEGWPIRAIRFPVAGPVSYWDDWGACRDGCSRHHIGNDVIADRLQPLLATTDGVITHIVDNHPTAGWGLVITDAEGWEYRYYHMNNDSPGTDDGSNPSEWRFVEGLTEGTVVSAGQVVGWVGDSGNSEGSVPHLHFEIHDPAGTAVNPYQSLRLAEWVGRCNNLGDPYRDVIFPMPTPEQATMVVPTPTGNGQFLLAPDGTWVPLGDAVQVGYSVHAAQDPACTSSYGDAIPGVMVGQGGYNLDTVLAAIRAIESGSNYTAQSRGSSASGAYQFIDSTWQSLGGTGHAKDAPAAEQDARARAYVERILAENGGDVALVPVIWYIGSVPQGAEWDTVPRPDAANVLTPRQYQSKWIAAYNRLAGF